MAVAGKRHENSNTSGIRSLWWKVADDGMGKAVLVGGRLDIGNLVLAALRRPVGLDQLEAVRRRTAALTKRTSERSAVGQAAAGSTTSKPRT